MHDVIQNDTLYVHCHVGAYCPRHPLNLLHSLYMYHFLYTEINQHSYSNCLLCKLKYYIDVLQNK